MTADRNGEHADAHVLMALFSPDIDPGTRRRADRLMRRAMARGWPASRLKPLLARLLRRSPAGGMETVSG